MSLNTPLRGSTVKNFYTASEAQKRLGISKSQFFYLVRKGTIKKVTFPGKKQGVYPKPVIDKFAATIKALIEQYEPGASRFEPATFEDLPIEVEIDMSLYGQKGTTPLQSRVERLQRNPESNFVLRFEGQIVGHVALYPVDRQYLQKLLHNQVSGIPAEMVLPWLIDAPLDVFISIISVRPGFTLDVAKHFGLRLIAGAISFLKELGERGVVIENIYCTSRTEMGIHLANKLGMVGEEFPEEPGRWRFHLSVEASDNLLIGEYKEGLALFRAQHQSDS